MAEKIAPQSGNRMEPQGSEVASQEREYWTDCPRKSVPTPNKKEISKIKDEPNILLKTRDQKSDKMPHPNEPMILKGLSVIQTSHLECCS